MNFSVIIPTRKRNKLLIALLKSINTNTYNHKLDIIIVQSGSKQEANTTINTFNCKNALWNVKIVHTEDLGPSHARNAGIAYAKWQHIIFVDDDCLVTNTFFQNYQHLWNQYPTVRIIGGKVLPTSTQGKRFTPKQIKFMYEYYGSFGITTLGDNDRILRPGELVYTANMSYRLSGQRKNSLFDERLGKRLTNTMVIYAEDYELCTRVLLNKEKVVYSPQVVVYNHISPNRFSRAFLNKHAVVSGMEQAFMEKILNDKFNGAYEKTSIVHTYKTAVKDLFLGRNVRDNIQLFNSSLKLRFVFSYLLNKKYMYA